MVKNLPLYISSCMKQNGRRSLKNLPRSLNRLNDSNDPFIIASLEVMLGSKKKKLALIHQDPDLAERIFTVFGDSQLGELYVKTYRYSDERHHSAYFISVALGNPVPRRNPVLLFNGQPYQRDLKLWGA